MAKSILSFSAPATFKARVDIPMPGGKTAPVEVTYKYKDRASFKEWQETQEKFESDVDRVLDIATAWDLAEPFNKGTLLELDNINMQAIRYILYVYFEEITGVKLGN